MNIEDIRLTPEEIYNSKYCTPEEYRDLTEVEKRELQDYKQTNAATDKANKWWIEWLECRNVFTGNGRIEFEMKESDFIALKSKE